LVLHVASQNSVQKRGRRKRGANFFYFHSRTLNTSYIRKSGTNLHVAGDVRSRVWKLQFTYTIFQIILVTSKHPRTCCHSKQLPSQGSGVTNWRV
jgi:hypothetical protein